jgi:hypothetical protein
MLKTSERRGTVAKVQQAGSFGDNMRHMLRALRGRNYAMFFIGQGLSVIGSWMQMTAMGILIWQMTGNALYLGLVGFFGSIFGFMV